MPHWRALTEPMEYFGRTKIAAFNLIDEKDVAHDAVFKILSVNAGEIVDEAGKKSKKPILVLKDKAGKEWSFPTGATCNKTIEKLYGGNTDGWPQKLIQLFVTTTHAKGGEEVFCLRVRPQVPAAGKAAPNNRPNARTEPPKQEQLPEQKPMRQPGEDG